MSRTDALTVFLVTREGVVMAIHSRREEAEEDRDIRTSRGSRPDLDRLYAIEPWRVQDSRHLADGECPYCNDAEHFRRLELEGGGHVHQLIRAN